MIINLVTANCETVIADTGTTTIPLSQATYTRQPSISEPTDTCLAHPLSYELIAATPFLQDVPCFLIRW